MGLLHVHVQLNNGSTEKWLGSTVVQYLFFFVVKHAALLLDAFPLVANLDHDRTAKASAVLAVFRVNVRMQHALAADSRLHVCPTSAHTCQIQLDNRLLQIFI